MTIPDTCWDRTRPACRGRGTFPDTLSPGIPNSRLQKIEIGNPAVILESARYPEHPVWVQPEIAGGEIVNGRIDKKDVHFEIISETTASRFGKQFDFDLCGNDPIGR